MAATARPIGRHGRLAAVSTASTKSSTSGRCTFAAGGCDSTRSPSPARIRDLTRVQRVDADRSVRPEDLSVSCRSAAACVTADIAHGPRSNCSSAAAVSSTSRSKTDVRGDAAVAAHRTEQMQQHLQPMAAEIHHRPAAGIGPVQQPAPRLARRRIEPLERVHLREHRLPDLA